MGDKEHKERIDKQREKLSKERQQRERERREKEQREREQRERREKARQRSYTEPRKARSVPDPKQFSRKGQNAPPCPGSDGYTQYQWQQQRKAGLKQSITRIVIILRSHEEALQENQNPAHT